MRAWEIGRTYEMTVRVRVEADSEAGAQHAAKRALDDLHLNVCGASVSVGGYSYATQRKRRSMRVVPMKAAPKTTPTGEG